MLAFLLLHVACFIAYVQASPGLAGVGRKTIEVRVTKRIEKAVVEREGQVKAVGGIQRLRNSKSQSTFD